ncbi:MAG: DUF1501 domain-containing protein [Actinomycetota bacterium]
MTTHPTLSTGAARPPAATSLLSRRGFLGMAGRGLLVGAAAAGSLDAVDRLVGTSAGATMPYAATGGAVDTGLILVTVQLQGGLDFLDTVIPADSDRYRRLRRRSGVDLAAAHTIDRDFVLHPELGYLAGRWHEGEVGIVHGVGYPDSSLSHFVDTAIWERGSDDPTVRTGWIGRSLDAFAGADADPMLGVSIGTLSPSMYAPGWNPVALAEDGRLPWTAEFIDEHPDLVRAYSRLMSSTANSMGDQSLVDRVRSSQLLVRDVADTIGGATDLDALRRTVEMLEESEEEDETGGDALSRRLGIVADLIKGGLPTRAYHVAHGGDFDTHASQVASLPALLRSLDRAVQTFDERLGDQRSRVVLATWTEFGRRPDWNGSGTDHGTAGAQFVIGPRAVSGHHGTPPSLERFDHDDNFIVTGDYRSYLAGLAQGVLGVDGQEILGTGVDPMEVVA